MNLIKPISAIVLTITFFCSNTISAQEASVVFEAGKRHASDIKRDKASKGVQIVELAGLEQGMKVFDLLGGGGYYSEIIADKVGETGHVYLHNNKAYMPWIEKELVARLKDNRLTNVTRYDRETPDMEIIGKDFDAMFYVLGYHDIYHEQKDWKIDRDSFLKQITGAIKSGGKLVIIDHSAKDGTGIDAAQELHRIDVNYVKNEVSSLGFKLVTESDLLANANDKRTISPFKPEMRRKTDRFVLIFEKN